MFKGHKVAKQPVLKGKNQHYLECEKCYLKHL